MPTCSTSSELPTCRVRLAARHKSASDPSVQRILDAMTEVPAYVRNARLDILSANRLGYALYSEVFTDPVRPTNMARFLFLNQRAGDFFGDWERIANDSVAILRAAAGRDPYDRNLSDLIGELSTRSEEFRVRWAAHNVKFHRTGVKTLHHPLVGDPHPQLRSARTSRRWRAKDPRLHRRTGLAVTRSAEPPRQLERDAGSRSRRGGSGRTLNDTFHCH